MVCKSFEMYRYVCTYAYTIYNITHIVLCLSSHIAHEIRIVQQPSALPSTPACMHALQTADVASHHYDLCLRRAIRTDMCCRDDQAIQICG